MNAAPAAIVEMPASGALLADLRAATAAHHDRLDMAFSGGAFRDRDGYARFLIMQALVLPSAEALLAGSREYRTLPDWDSRFRSAALAGDLARLGLPMPAPHALDVNAALPGSAAGVAYVLEGSRLGGRLIAQKLTQAGMGDMPTAFIAHGAEARHWQSFRAWLDGRPSDGAYADAAVQAAIAVFERYIAVAAAVATPLRRAI